MFGWCSGCLDLHNNRFVLCAHLNRHTKRSKRATPCRQNKIKRKIKLICSLRFCSMRLFTCACVCVCVCFVGSVRFSFFFVIFKIFFHLNNCNTKCKFDKTTSSPYSILINCIHSKRNAHTHTREHINWYALHSNRNCHNSSQQFRFAISIIRFTCIRLVLSCKSR